MLFEQQLSKNERVTRFCRAAANLEQLFNTDSKHRIVAQIEEQITTKLTALIKIGAELQFKTPDVTSDLASRTEFRAFCAQIEHEDVYALAINEQYEQGAYTLKRVRTHELVTGDWICQIWADNPDADWGERGQVDIRRTDHVQFAARLIGLSKNPEPSEGNDTEVVFDPIDV